MKSQWVRTQMLDRQPHTAQSLAWLMGADVRGAAASHSVYSSSWCSHTEVGWAPPLTTRRPSLLLLSLALTITTQGCLIGMLTTLHVNDFFRCYTPVHSTAFESA